VTIRGGCDPNICSLSATVNCAHPPVKYKRERAKKLKRRFIGRISNKVAEIGGADQILPFIGDVKPAHGNLP